VAPVSLTHTLERRALYHDRLSRTAVSMQLDLSPYKLWSNAHTHRRRDATVELSRVGVGGVYWV